MGKVSILITRVDDKFIDENYDKLFDSLYQARKEAVKKFNNKNAAYTSITAGLLLGRAFEMTYGQPSHDIIVEKGEYGKPFIKGSEEFKYNLSHSGDYVVLAYTMDKDIASIGIDVEKIKVRDSDMKVANRFFAKDEIDYISNGLECSDIDMRFYKIWTMKEAFIKLTGKGLGQRLDSFSVNPDDLSISLADNISYDMKVVDKHIISVCADSDDYVIYDYTQITLDKPA